jgi:NAD+ synthase (glutamine-hydrolysing)
MSIKIFLAQQNYHIGNIEYNERKMYEAIDRAREAGADLIVFSELSLCGYPPGDFLYFDAFIHACEEAVNRMVAYAPDMGVLLGVPVRNPEVKGKDLYNAALFLYEGKVLQTIYKTCLPTYDVFDEDRYFEPSRKWKVVLFKGKKLAVTICEDIWNLGNNPLYLDCPMDRLMPFHPDIMINLSASPFDYTHIEDRKAVIKANVLKYKIPMFYCNAIGSQTEIVFDGSSMVFDGHGNLCGVMKSFEEEDMLFECDDHGNIRSGIIEKVDEVPETELAPENLQADLNIDVVYHALILGVRDYFKKMGFTKAILGSSGGIDSAVVLALACEALGSENVTAILMPGTYSTGHSVSDATALSLNLNNPYHVISIKDIYDTFLSTLHPLFENLPFSVAEENIQSRTRGNLLMAIANKFNYILLNTSNKSELATGYGTLYGDMAGGISVIGDCYKTQVYALARYINRNGVVIPENIIEKAPSAELRPDQKDSDSLPDYAILDAILYQYIEWAKSPADIVKNGFDEKLVQRVMKMVNINEYKRKQFCPIIRISPKAFGVGRRIPVVAKYLS